MNDDERQPLLGSDPQRAELNRVKQATTPWKSFGRVFGLGPSAKSVINEALSSPDASPKSVARALNGKVVVSHGRYELLMAPVRSASLLAACAEGILLLLGKATIQDRIGHWLRESAEKRASIAGLAAAAGDPGKTALVREAIEVADLRWPDAPRRPMRDRLDARPPRSSSSHGR